MSWMDPAQESAYHILDEVRAQGNPSGPVTLNRDYLADVAAVEIRHANQSGADKTWVRDAIEEFRVHYAAVRRSR